MTKRTEALSAAYQQLIRDHGKNITEEQFVCYALDAMQKLDAANTPPDQPTVVPTGLITEDLDPNDPL